MRKKMAIAAVVFALLVVQAQTVFADVNSDFFEAIYRVGDLNLAKRLLERGADINKRDSWFRSVRESTPFIKNGTILMLSAINGKFDKVIFLIENGAKVNLRDDNGATAASLSYDAGEIEIFNYLKEHGAIDFEPKQAVVQPSTTNPSSQTNVYVQSTPEQSAPAQRPAPSAPTLNTGTFSWSNSGQNMTMVIRAGMVTFNVNGRMAWTGAYTINGRQIVLSVYNTTDNYKNLRGMTFSYNIDSDTSFSGSGETWVRTGF